MIKIKMTYDEKKEKDVIIKAINEVIDINRVMNIPDEKRKRICVWGKLKIND